MGSLICYVVGANCNNSKASSYGKVCLWSSLSLFCAMACVRGVPYATRIPVLLQGPVPGLWPGVPSEGRQCHQSLIGWWAAQLSSPPRTSVLLAQLITLESQPSTDHTWIPTVYGAPLQLSALGSSQLPGCPGVTSPETWCVDNGETD